MFMWLGRNWVIRLMVPNASLQLFLGAWLISALTQPINAVSFLTDGVHWGTGDFTYLRNAMLFSSGVGILGLWLLERSGSSTLIWIWILISAWSILRGLFGVLRIWPGIGKSVFRTGLTDTGN